jgi:hypothetical protein
LRRISWKPFLNPGFQSKPWAGISQRFQRKSQLLTATAVDEWWNVCHHWIDGWYQSSAWNESLWRRKAAVRCMVRSWIQDIKGSGIRINVLSAGAVDTPSLRSALGSASGADKVDAAVKSMGEGNPLGRLADPREIGKAAVFLASDASSFITGVESLCGRRHGTGLSYRLMRAEGAVHDGRSRLQCSINAPGPNVSFLMACNSDATITLVLVRE